MDLTLLLLATTAFGQAWAKWFFIGLGIGIPVVIIAAVMTYFQTKKDSADTVSEDTDQHDEVSE